MDGEQRPAAAPTPEGPLNSGAPTTPRAATSVILLRGGAEALEVLLVQRSPAARFMGSAWVFPGGAVERSDGAADGRTDDDAAHRLAGLRELGEEASIRIDDPAALVPFSRWITPEELKIRFDARFYLARAPRGSQPCVDGAECVAWRWLTPAGALDANARGELLLFFPTIKHLEQLAGFGSADELLDHARGREVVAVQPRVVGSGEEARIVLPGES